MQPTDRFIDIIKAHEGLIYKVTTVYAYSKEDREDLYQEIVYQLWKSFASFKGLSKLSTWIYRVALNTAITFSKRAKKERSVSEIDFEHLFYPEQEGAEEEIKLQVLQAHIKQLNMIEKGLILLYLESKSYEEIATITGFSVTNVGTKLGRIKNKLKTQIKNTEAWN